jgi:hypothetical protein
MPPDSARSLQDDEAPEFDEDDAYLERCERGDHRLIESPDVRFGHMRGDPVCADCGYEPDSAPSEQCAFEDGMVTYTRCVRPVASVGAVYCERHAVYEPRDCEACDFETSDFQEREGTHEHQFLGSI